MSASGRRISLIESGPQRIALAHANSEVEIIDFGNTEDECMRD